MSAVWRAARAAVQRRKLQTFVLGLVVLISTGTTVVALALLDASNAPFDHAFNARHGAHLVATYDSGKVTDAQLTGAAGKANAVSGPYRQAVVAFTDPASGPGPRSVQLTVVGRGDPAGPVDELKLWKGRWATGPGEIVLSGSPPRPGDLERIPLDGALTGPTGQSFKIVGYAYSLSQTADAWVSPQAIAGLHPTTTQMLYRFAQATPTKAEIATDLTAVTSGLPAKALLASQSYLVIKQSYAAGAGTLVPFLGVFGALGLIVSVLIVGNVVSGAVVSGFQHIGILKALGFTPNQVIAVYLIMVSLPAGVGCVLGTVLGDLGARPLLTAAFEDNGLATAGVRPGVLLVGLLGMPALVLLAALVPALRARRLPAAVAISAGAAPRVGRAPGIPRRLSGTRLPRSVSLGLGLPFARPGRTALTLASVLLGVVTVVFSTGMVSTVTRFSAANTQVDYVQVDVRASHPPDDPHHTTRADEQIEATLRGLPGARYVTADLQTRVTLLGTAKSIDVDFLRGDYAHVGYPDELVKGRWLKSADEVVVPSKLAHERGLSVGDRLTIQLADAKTDVKIVGLVMSGAPGGGSLLAGWQTLDRLDPSYRADPSAMLYQVGLDRGASVDSYRAAVTKADQGLDAMDHAASQENTFSLIVVSLSTILTLLLGTVAALGVFNTVVLNTRERRRDLGMLKAIGMTPRQVVTMVVTSMAALGVVGGVIGVPLGIVAHRLIVPVISRAATVDLPPFLLDVWQVPVLAALAFAGVVIAVLGALIPAASAARLPIAQVLRNE